VFQAAGKSYVSFCWLHHTSSYCIPMLLEVTFDYQFCADVAAAAAATACDVL
jgi:hypothetical protein